MAISSSITETERCSAAVAAASRCEYAKQIESATDNSIPAGADPDSSVAVELASPSKIPALLGWQIQRPFFDLLICSARVASAQIQYSSYSFPAKWNGRLRSYFRFDLFE